MFSSKGTMDFYSGVPLLFLGAGEGRFRWIIIPVRIRFRSAGHVTDAGRFFLIGRKKTHLYQISDQRAPFLSIGLTFSY